MFGFLFGKKKAEPEERFEARTNDQFMERLHELKKSAQDVIEQTRKNQEEYDKMLEEVDVLLEENKKINNDLRDLANRL